MATSRSQSSSPPPDPLDILAAARAHKPGGTATWFTRLQARDPALAEKLSLLADQFWRGELPNFPTANELAAWIAAFRGGIVGVTTQTVVHWLKGRRRP
jgi:hypothetical protein